MTTPSQAKSPINSSVSSTQDTEALASLLQALDDELALVDMPHLQAFSMLDVIRSRLADIRAQTTRLSQIRAPWLDLGRSRFRWLTYPLNLLVWPWGRKQAICNTETQQVLRELVNVLDEMRNTLETATSIESRLSRIEAWQQALIGHLSLPTEGGHPPHGASIDVKENTIAAHAVKQA